jgi:hypothetical protein
VQSIPDDARLVRRDRVLANDLNDSETVMLDVDQGTYYGVTGTGRSIWDLLAEPATPDTIVAALLTEYEVDEDTCRTEVHAFLDDLIEQGLLDVGDPETAS